MFSFKKPKRNLRVREANDEDSETEVPESINTNSSDKHVKKVKKPVTHQSLLSFGEDLNEGDDGEVFKVKKSNQSKKIKKQLEKERKKKKEKTDGNSSNNTDKSQTQSTIDDDMIIKLKNTFPILNGREAEAATVGGISEDEDDDLESDAPRFIKQTDSVKLLIKRGTIPDAATIHAARKQRQHVREMGESLPAAEDIVVHESKSRLIREDDNDGSDGEEERINMTVNTAIEDRLRRKAEFDAAQDYGEESDKGEDDEWEAQQIRKGVTGAQIAAVQQENMYYQQYMGNGLGMTMATPSEIQVVEQMPMEQPYMVFPPLPSTGAIDPQEVIKKLKDRLTDLNEVHRRHKLDTMSGLDEIESLRKECERIKGEGPQRAERFRFYQDLRGYVTDLVECLDEKIVIIGLLEERVVSMHSRKVAEYIARRRQDVMDQAQELSPSAQKMRVDRDEAQVRRVAEREGRRIRRQRVRELKGVQGHMEGMSSDEEVTEAEAVSMRNQKDIIEQDARHVFEDVLDEFGTVRGILQRFESWRSKDLDAYTEAYVSLCLSKILGPIVRLKLLFWNPIMQGGTDFEKAPWYNSLLLYGLDETETEDVLKKDPDAMLIPRVVEQIILRKLTQLVTECWDPLSSSQTVSLVALVTKLIQDYPTLTHKSKCLTTFFETVLAKMKESVENDVYIPIYPPQRLNEGKVSNFFMRQCTVAIKLLGNLTRWQGVLSDSVLSDVALNSLLNRSLLCAIRTCSTMQAANLCQMIGNVLPRIWLQVCVHPPQLTQFLNQTKLIAKSLDIDKPLERRLNEGKVSNFFMRQCTVAIKLLGNLTRWQGVLSDSVLSDVALNSLLNRSLLCAIRTCSTMQAANLCQMIGNVLPRIWLQVCVHPPQLTQFLNQTKLIAKSLDIDKPLERDALERMSGVLKAAASL